MEMLPRSRMYRYLIFKSETEFFFVVSVFVYPSYSHAQPEFKPKSVNFKNVYNFDVSDNFL